MRRFTLAVLLILPVAFGFSLTGCNSGPALHEVAGTVRYDDNPLPEGVIEFWPLDNQGTKSSTMIVNGDYKIPRDKGLEVGKYRVSIICGDGYSGAGDAGLTPTKGKAQGGGGKPGEERSPVEYYGATSKQVAEVKSSGENKFDFSVPKRKS